MKVTDYLSLMTRNSFRNRRRSLLTVSSLAVSLCLLGLLMAMYRALFFGGETTPAQALRLVTHNRVSLAQPMPASSEQKIQQLPGVQAVMVRQWFGGTYRDARDTRNFFARFAVRPAKLFQIYSELGIPEDQKEAFVRQRTACVVSRELANKFGWNPGERIALAGDIWAANLELTLVGVFDDPDHNEVLFFNHDYLRESLAPSDANRDLHFQLMVQAQRPEETARSEADLEQVRADLENARVTLARTRTLVEQGILARQSLDDAEARYNAQTARYASFEKSYALVRTGPRREEIEAMRAQVRQAEGTLAFAQSQLENTVIHAPISGVILGRNVERGEFVTTGFVGDRGAKGYVVSLADLGDLQAELDINQNDFAKLGASQPATVTTDAYPDRKYRGVIAEISPEANRQKATVQVKVKVLNPDEYLRPEMNASVAFHSSDRPEEHAETRPLLTIPASAVREGAVFVVVDGKAVRRQVQVSGASPQGVMVASGLIGGEDVIASPPAGLKEGQKVRPKEKQP